MMYGKSSDFFFGVSHNHKGKFVSNVESNISNAYMCGVYLVVGMDLEIFSMFIFFVIKSLEKVGIIILHYKCLYLDI